MKNITKVILIFLLICFNASLNAQTKIAEFSGNGGKNTNPFTVNEPWEITWDSSGSIFQLYLYDMNGGLIGVPANQTSSGKGSSFQVAKGKFYLQVNALDTWTIVIKSAESKNNDSNTTNSQTNSIAEFSGDGGKNNTAYDFRETHWGMTKEQVKMTEKSGILQEQDRLLLYFGTASDLECFILYFFAYDTLFEAKYIFFENHERRNQYISDFENVKKNIISKYGNPKDDGQIWSNKEYKDDIDLRGLAISLGHVIYYTKWSTDRSEIMEILSGDKYILLLPKYITKNREAIIAIMTAGNKTNNKHILVYTSLKHKILNEKIEKEQQINDF